MVQNKLLLSLTLAHKHKTKYQMEIIYHNDTRELFLIWRGGALKGKNSNQCSCCFQQ